MKNKEIIDKQFRKINKRLREIEKALEINLEWKRKDLNDLDLIKKRLKLK